MITIKDKQLQDEIKEGIADLKSISKYLINTYPVTQIADALAEVIMMGESKPIVITEEQLKQYFRIQGRRPDGTPENRGRKTTNP